MGVIPRCIILSLVLVLAHMPGWAADPEIAVWEAEGRRTKAVVMDADGSNRTLIFERKFSRLGTSPSWSPSGDWVAIRAEDDNGAALYKVRVDGTDLTKVLCSAGTYGDESDAFDIQGGSGSQWSPDGNWILLWVDIEGAPWLGIIGADEEPDEDCHSNLIPLYYPGWEPVQQTGWWMQGTPAWNHDGSRIAVFEDYETFNNHSNWRLQILEFSVVNGEPTVTGESPVWPLPPSLQLVMESFPVWDLDWQRQNGDLLTFDTKEGEVGERVEWVSWIDSTTGAWGHLTEGFDATWSPDNSRIAYNGPGLTISDLSYDGNGIPRVVSYQTIGSGMDPDWKRDQLIIGCESDSVCNDGNPCTDDYCALTCQHDDVANGSTPLGCSGECWGGTCTVAKCAHDDDCVDDGNSCTVPTCVDAGLPWAHCDFNTKNCGTDDGCCPPGCDFLNDGDGDCPSCLPKGDICSANAECCSGQCHPKRGTCK